MRNRPWSALIAAALVAAIALPAHAAEQTILGKTITVQAGASAADGKVKITAKEAASADTLVGDPVAAGATLTVTLSGANPSEQTFTLPQGADAKGKPFWKGTPAKGFQYKDKDGVNGAVSSVKIKKAANGTFTLKVQIAGENGPVSLLPPNPGTGACVLLTLGGGDTYSIAFTEGEIVKNDALAFKMKKPTGEGTCVPATTTTTQFTTTSTTTSTLPETTTTTLGSICPNGVIEEGEDCDDGNPSNGDGCSDSCELELTAETEPNTMCGTANGPFLLSQVDHGVGIAAAINPPSDVDFYAFSLIATSDVSIETFDSTGPGSCSPSTIDTVIDLYSPACQHLFQRDQGGIGNCSRLSAQDTAVMRGLAPGTYFVRVSAFSAAATFDYSMQIRLLSICGNGTTDGSEECDGGAGCDTSCQRIPVCSDGFIDAPEQCDDSNMFDGDGCSSSCMNE